MRLFIGIPLAAEVVDELQAIRMRLYSIGDGLRWSAPQSWHITLQFLGNARLEQQAGVVARLRELRAAPVSIALEGLAVFDRAGIFYAGVRLTPALMQLQERVTEITMLCGFVPESRPYQPHITLARSKGSEGRESLSKLKAKIQKQATFTRFVAKAFLLYESIPGAGGSRYEVRERFGLGG